MKKKHIEALLANNLRWAAQFAQDHPGIFEQLSRQQSPRYLWIGCSDSRIPANEVMGLMPGEVFVHRNVGNLVYAMDINCHSVIQYASEISSRRFNADCFSSVIDRVPCVERRGWQAKGLFKVLAAPAGKKVRP